MCLYSVARSYLCASVSASVCVYVSFWDNKSAPPNIPGAGVRSTNELWKQQCSTLDVAKQMVIARWNVVIQTNTSHFLYGIITTKYSKCFRKVAPFRVQCINFSSFGQIESVNWRNVATIDCMYFMIFSLNLYFSSFTLCLTQGLRYSMRIKWIAFQSLHLLMFCILCFSIVVIVVSFYWCNESFMSEQYWRTIQMMIMKTSFISSSSSVFLLCHGISIVCSLK